MLGRFVWSSTSDVLSRKNIYRMYLGVGALLHLALTFTTNADKVVFLVCRMRLRDRAWYSPRWPGRGWACRSRTACTSYLSRSSPVRRLTPA